MNNKVILIIGGTGSLGNELTDRFYRDNKVIIFSRDENKQWSMSSKYKENVSFCIGDTRDKQSIITCIKQNKPNIIILAAALKHIDICERNISECIATNITGIKNVIDIVIDMNDKTIEKLLLISTDKSCSPINVYGMSKAISERLIAEASTKECDTKFVCVRYGNVLNSRGSLLPKYKEIASNIDSSKRIFPVTDKSMTRFFMTLPQAVNLICYALDYAESGDTVVPRIFSFNIYNIAEYFANKYDGKVLLMGLRPGEKFHECLVNETEIHRTKCVEVGDQIYYIIKPCYSNYNYKDLHREYTSFDTSDIMTLLPLIENLLIS